MTLGTLACYGMQRGGRATGKRRRAVQERRPMDEPRSTETPLAAARRFAPQVAACSEQIERERRLPEALVAALCEAGLFRMLLPASAGGLEVAPRISAEAIETIAAADASTGWCLSQANGCATIASYLETAAAREVFSERRAILAWGPPS